MNMEQKDKYKIVLGNGFDLFCEIKTSYSNFFSYFSTLYDEIKKWSNKILFKENYYDSFLDITTANSEDFCPPLLDDDVTIWDICFCFQNFNEHSLWCDVEVAIKKSVVGLFDDNFFSWKRVFDVISVGKKTKVISERICAIFAKQNHFPTKNYDEFMFVILEELKKFEKRFGKYVQLEAKKIFYSLNYYTTIEKLTGSLYNIAVIDTFNYTFVENDVFVVNHINGMFEQPIFGIDTANIKCDSIEYIFTKTYRRQEMKIQGNYNINIVLDFNKVVVFGHSLNEQDYNYFFPLLDELGVNDPNFGGKIIFAFYVYNMKDEQKIIRNQITAVANLFFKYEEYSRPNLEHRLFDILVSKDALVFKRIYNDSIINE